MAETLARPPAGSSRDSLVARDIGLGLAGMLAVLASASVVGPRREVSVQT
jgi:hypothetical protein